MATIVRIRQRAHEAMHFDGTRGCAEDIVSYFGRCALEIRNGEWTGGILTAFNGRAAKGDYVCRLSDGYVVTIRGDNFHDEYEIVPL